MTKQGIFLADLLRFFLAATCLPLFFSSAGCSRQDATPLRVGSAMWPGFEAFYVARELGYWNADRTRLVEYASTSETIRAFRNGTIDGGMMTLDEALLLTEDAADIRVVMVADVSNGADVILAKPEFGSMRDLKGHRIGAETTALGAYVLLRALQLSGLTREDVEIVPLDFSEDEAAFTHGIVDAVVTYEPTRTKLRNVGARQIFDSSQMPGEIVDVLVMHAEYVRAYPDAVQLLLRSFYRAQGYFKEKPQDFVRIAAARENTTQDEFRSSLTLLRLLDANESRAMLTGQPPLLLKNARLLAALMVDQKLLHKTVDVESLFDERMLDGIYP
jgi:NitT/TauT family transport system substrate-binding protein